MLWLWIYIDLTFAIHLYHNKQITIYSDINKESTVSIGLRDDAVSGRSTASFCKGTTMGILADRLDSMRIETSSPDGQVVGVFRPRAMEVSVQFRGGSYRHYREPGLGYQLSALATRWWTEFERDQDAAVAEATGRPVVKSEPWDANQRRFRAEKAETVFEGMSARAYVFVQCTGLRRWQVVVRDGALSALDEHEFAAEVASGYAAMMRDCRSKTAQLHKKHYARR